MLLRLLEVLAAVCAVILMLSFVLTYLYGQETRCARMEEDQEKYADRSSRHRLYRRVFLGALIISIIMIEGMVWEAGRPYEFTWLKAVHYAFDASFFSLLVLVFRYNGKRSPTKHKKYVPWLAAYFAGVFVTGLPLYVQFCIRTWS